MKKHFRGENEIQIAGKKPNRVKVGEKKFVRHNHRD